MRRSGLRERPPPRPGPRSRRRENRIPRSVPAKRRSTRISSGPASGRSTGSTSNGAPCRSRRAARMVLMMSSVPTPALGETVALVTGASSGIGEATALELARLGAGVALVARRRDRLEQLAGKIQQAGARALVIEADMSSLEEARTAVERTVSELGRLDTLVNNAGVMLLGPVEDAPIEEWQRMLAVNVAGLLYCAHAALPHLLQAAQDGPRQVADMINISSVAGRVARVGSGVYNLTKH